MGQLVVTNNKSEKWYLYKQSTTTSNKGKVTLHFFNKKPNFCPDTVQVADKIPKGHQIHEDPFTNRIVCRPDSDIEVMLTSVYKEEV